MKKILYHSIISNKMQNVFLKN